jgi:hypothetical protein
MTQKQVVLDHLLSGKELSSIEAINLYGVTRLGAYILILKKEGYIINSRRQKVKNRFGHISNPSIYSISKESLR